MILSKKGNSFLWISELWRQLKCCTWNCVKSLSVIPFLPISLIPLVPGFPGSVMFFFPKFALFHKSETS